MPLPTLNAPKFLPTNDLQGPCYAGICLPKNALDLFPTRNLNRTYVSCDIIDQDLTGLNLLGVRPQFSTFLNDSINNEGGDESSVISSLSDVSSSASRRPAKWQIAKHARSQCLHCTRSRRQLRLLSQDPNSTSNGLGGTLAPCELYSSAAAALVAAGMQAGPALARKNTGGKTTGIGSAGGSIQLGDMSFHSPESILSEESLPDKLTASILYNVQRLANPVSAKQSKMALLELKQKHPHAFQDICLYSEACKTLGRSSYRMSARRFLHELFLDLNFDSFYVEPQLIISTRKQPVDEQPEPFTGAPSSSSSSSSSTLTGAGTTATGTAVGATSPSIPTPPTPSAALLGHKSQLKPKSSAQLESVYETSCEHLLMEQSPRLDSITAPRPFLSLLQQKLSSPEEKSLSKSRNEDSNYAEMDSDEDDAGEDVCDGSGAGTQASSVTTANTALPAGNSNRSSISAAAALTTSSAPVASTTSSCRRTSTDNNELVNENRQYRRGRFYTLELDLSCTKNKFPITDRSRKTTPKGSKTPDQDQDPAQLTPLSGNLRQNSQEAADASASQFGSRSGTPSFAYMTKSLAASMTKPVGSLYCEKRLQTSKSEAVLADDGGIGGAGGNVSGSGSGNGSIKWPLAGAAAATAAASSSSSTTKPVAS